MKRFIGLGITLISISFFFCAKEKPLPSGYELLDRDNKGQIRQVVLPTLADTTYFGSKINTGHSSYLCLGSNEGYQSRIFLQFSNLPDSAEVNSAELILYTHGIWGEDDAVPFEATAHPVLASWSEDDTIGADLEVDWGKTVATATITASDSDSVVFVLDSALVTDWCDTTKDNYGVVITSSGATFVKEFYARDYTDNSKRPVLHIIYTKDGERDTADFKPVYDSFDPNGNIELAESGLYIGKGLSFWSFLRFDLSQDTLLNETATINGALVKLIIDRDNSIRDAQGAGDAILYPITASSWEREQVTIDSLATGYSGEISGDTLTVDITSIFQWWSAGFGKNFGLMLRSKNEWETIARVAFFSSEDSLRAPKIELTYTLPPSSRY